MKDFYAEGSKARPLVLTRWQPKRASPNSSACCRSCSLKASTSTRQPLPGGEADFDQVWEQLQLRNKPLVRYLKKCAKKLLTEEDQITLAEGMEMESEVNSTV